MFMAYLNKTMNTNPSRGHRHFRAPSMMIYKAIRGMIAHKTTRGAEALKRLHVYDGCPPRYSRVKKMVIPDALRTLVMKPTSKYIRLGDLASRMGWSYGPLIKKLERSRLHYAKVWYHRKVRAMKKHQKALKAFRHLIPKKAHKKDVKKEEAKTEEKKPETQKKKKHFSMHGRRLHKLAIIQKVNKLEADAKKKSNKMKMQKALERKQKRVADEKKAANIKKQEALKKKKEQRKARHQVSKKGEKKPTSTPKETKKAPKAKTTKVAKKTQKTVKA